MWTADDIPDQTGRTAVVTGGNAGLGLETSRELARKGAHVVLACRNEEKGRAAAADIAQSVGGDANLEVAELDLASQASVKAFADAFLGRHDSLDLLVNNAGLLAPPRRETVDGWELQFATHHLGHFALTQRLVGSMEGREDARIVMVTSLGHHLGSFRFDDLQRKRRYFRYPAYNQSKLANLMFALELDRRLRVAGSTIRALAAHPGFSATEFGARALVAFDRTMMKVTNRLLSQTPSMGALPTLYAATEPEAEGGIVAISDLAHCAASSMPSASAATICVNCCSQGVRNP